MSRFFEELLESVREIDDIVRGLQRPSREFHVETPKNELARLEPDKSNLSANVATVTAQDDHRHESSSAAKWQYSAYLAMKALEY
ncbi:hypothetical protein [Pseudomonas sp. TWP3-2]|uniref:hypothetical protein n=1 Tax=Pseudomonas sp. TWP3-2 TaxID=2804574 RepID=UPI003CEBA716